MGHNHLIGSILGTAVGDSLGLPYEGLTRDRAVRLFGPPSGQRFALGKGMVSDDTEHTCMVAQSLIACGGDVNLFLQDFSRRLRVWLVALPAGVGFATLRAVLLLWLGRNPKRSGVYSAGNGPSMRAPILGAAIDRLDQLQEFVRASTRITHSDPKAEYGAFAVALAAHLACRNDSVSSFSFIEQFKSCVGGETNADVSELISLLDKVADSLERNESTPTFAGNLGLIDGVSGYAYHTVPIVLHSWLRNQQDFRSAATEVIQCGGDTDSTAAITGGIVGAGVGREGIPAEWIEDIWDWPCSVKWMERLAKQLAETIESGESAEPVRLPVSGVLLRNVVFLSIVLGHGFRRLFPPY